MCVFFLNVVFLSSCIVLNTRLGETSMTQEPSIKIHFSRVHHLLYLLPSSGHHSLGRWSSSQRNAGCPPLLNYHHIIMLAPRWPTELAGQNVSLESTSPIDSGRRVLFFQVSAGEGGALNANKPNRNPQRPFEVRHPSCDMGFSKRRQSCQTVGKVSVWHAAMIHIGMSAVETCLIPILEPSCISRGLRS